MSDSGRWSDGHDIPDPETGTGIAAVHILVYGQVQGVGFRAWTCHQATELGLTGWVRNRPFGEVEIFAEGTKKSLDAFIEAVGHGPRYSSVSRVQTEQTAPAGCKTFSIEY